MSNNNYGGGRGRGDSGRGRGGPNNGRGGNNNRGFASTNRGGANANNNGGGAYNNGMNRPASNSTGTSGGGVWGNQRPADGGWPVPGGTGPNVGPTPPQGAWGGNRGGAASAAPPPMRPTAGPNCGPSVGSNGPPSGSNGRPPAGPSGRQGTGEHGTNSGQSQRSGARGQRQDVSQEGRPTREKRGLGARPGDKVEDSRDDIVPSRNPKLLPTKQGTGGSPVNLISNYFKLEKRPNWSFLHYRVDFAPDEPTTKARKALFRVQATNVGTHIFDGYDLYTTNRLHPDPMELISAREADNTPVKITVRFVAEIPPTDATMLHFFNIIVRKSLQNLKLIEIKRNFFDKDAAQKSSGFEFWPGYITSMRQCENDVLLRVEIRHKLIRLDNVYHTISSLWRGPGCEARIREEVVDSIVMTDYNNKTYRITDVNFQLSPESEFDLKGTMTSYMQYYLTRHKITVRHRDQPLLVALPSKKDIHRGDTQIIYLIPELCRATGLTDAMRSNFGLMKSIGEYLHVGPDARIKKLNEFMTRMRNNPDIQADLTNWGLKYGNQLVQVAGRRLDNESIVFGHLGGQVNKQLINNNKAEWTLQSKDCPMIKNATLKNWVYIVPPERDAARVVEPTVKTMKFVAGQLGFQIPEPAFVFKIKDSRPLTYVNAINDAMEKCGGNLDLIFTLLPNNNVDTYAAIKRRCYQDLGVASQVFLLKNADHKNVMSILTKVVIQMNAKLGGIPWGVEVPNAIKETMMIGFDVYHCAGDKKKSVGAMVASTSIGWGEYYSTTLFHESREELATNVCINVGKALSAYNRKNGKLPTRIIFYRDGVGEGQLSYVYNIELDQIKNAIANVYGNLVKPMFTFVVVTKRIDTRLMMAEVAAQPQGAHSGRGGNSGRGGYSGRGGHSGPDRNPLPGTVVDDVITLPERYDFFLVSQTTRAGTVSPTAYHVLHDEQGWPSGRIQMVTNKMCHLYFNCSASVAVPAPCQYAHKLAYLTGIALNGAIQENLAGTLFYL